MGFKFACVIVAGITIKDTAKTLKGIASKLLAGNTFENKLKY